jgi:CheY-like chemotaxis protein
MASILIVDDDAAMRDALGEAARDLGHDTYLAASGTEAIALLDTKAIDAMLLDLRMPGMDGIEVLRRVRARPHPLPVTVLTAQCDRREHDRGDAARRV